MWATDDFPDIVGLQDFPALDTLIESNGAKLISR